MHKKKSLDAKAATKGDLKTLSARFDGKLRKNTNLIIEELSKDIRNAAKEGQEETIKVMKAEFANLRPRLTTTEDEQDILKSRLDNHEERLKKLETVSI
ncbi:MAG: hypothetical protein HY747_08715 [Elusimicrobia bacterium]|nr:hypothetical protein [Elusimicrobiota bacterium]